jgi:hypothetical protein
VVRWHGLTGRANECAQGGARGADWCRELADLPVKRERGREREREGEGEGGRGREREGEGGRGREGEGECGKVREREGEGEEGGGGTASTQCKSITGWNTPELGLRRRRPVNLFHLCPSTGGACRRHAISQCGVSQPLNVPESAIY